MFRSISAFELRYYFKHPLFWTTTLLLGVLTYAAEVSDSITLGGGIGNVHRNAPYVIMQLMTVMSILGMFVITAFVAGSIYRDFEYNTHALFFTKPIRKLDYLGGRFSGSLAVATMVFLGPALGILIGSQMPWLEPERLGPTQLAPYVYTFLVFILPNLIFIGAVFFTLASLTRSLLFTYLGVVLFFVVWALSSDLASDLDNQYLASLLDPFGYASLNLATRYWTVVERNTALPPLIGSGSSLLVNRLIWMGVGLLVFVAGTLAFNPARTARVQRKRARLAAAEEAAAAAVAVRTAAGVPAATKRFSAATSWLQFLQQARIEVSGVLKSVPFLVILVFGMTNVMGSSGMLDSRFGTSVYPVTHAMLDLLEGTFVFLLVIIVTFYAGELVGKERTIKLNEVYDALPVPTWVTLASKLAALAAVVVAFLTAGALTAIGVQIYRGYYNFEPGLYARGLLLMAVPFLIISVLAVFLQVLTNSKFLGYLFMILYLLTPAVLSSLDFDHRLYRFASTPDTPYSDMNGYGHFLQAYFWFALYWSLFAVVLYGLSILLKVRGTESAWKARLRHLRERLRGPVRLALAGGLVAFAATGAYIFWNTNVLNEYIPGDEQERLQAEYEKKYRKYMDIAMPRITAVRNDVDIFPRERRIEARGHYVMVNKTAKPIEVLHINIDPRVKVKKLAFRDHTLVSNDEEQGYSIYKFKRPLAPGETMTFDFEVEASNRGFENAGSDTSRVYNGTFFNNQQYFPQLGYDESRQLVDRNDRRKHDLPVVHRMAKVNDLFARRNTYIAKDSDWIDFETVVSTSPDQIAVAPGYLQREWTEGGRRYFHYKMDAPILHFYSYLSADYKVKKDRWKDVAIEIYYHEPHGYNVDRMIDSIKKSLDYFTTNFSPYQHRQVRILEFPRYASFAQSFANTIPYSESIGFIANLREEEDIDYVFYVTAHEVAHQWWAHQVIGGNVQGSTLMSETLSQYSALMVMEKEYGKEKMRKFLKYELDNYLSSRGGELVEEMPLLLVENQGYIHYRKGSLIMYALKDAIGEEALNRALAQYIQAVKFQKPPFTNSIEFLKYVEAATPPDRRYLLDDMFRTITLFENRVTTASSAKRADGKYDVTLTVEAKKVRSDGQGVETPVQIGDWIDIGVFGEKPRQGEDPEETVLYLRKHRITQPTMTFRLVVDQPPVRAGIDPYNKLVDRNSDDNRKKVEAG
jgi:ABC-type transport system involved in multi-copper enzyme maturation permease subunit